MEIGGIDKQKKTVGGDRIHDMADLAVGRSCNEPVDYRRRVAG